MVKNVTPDELYAEAELATCVCSSSEKELYKDFKASINKKVIILKRFAVVTYKLITLVVVTVMRTFKFF